MAFALATTVLVCVPFVAGCGSSASQSASGGAKSGKSTPSSTIPIPANASPAIRGGRTLVTEAPANAGQVIVVLGLSGIPCTQYHVSPIDRQSAPGPIQTASCVVANHPPALEIAIYTSSADATTASQQVLACQRARSVGMTNPALLVVGPRSSIQVWNENQQALLVKAGLGTPISIDCLSSPSS
jgi:hypothetical protein